MGILRRFREWREQQDGTLEGPSLTIDGQNLTVTEDEGDFVAKDGNGNVIFRYDEANAQWVMDSLSTNSIGNDGSPIDATDDIDLSPGKAITGAVDQSFAEPNDIDVPANSTKQLTQRADRFGGLVVIHEDTGADASAVFLCNVITVSVVEKIEEFATVSATENGADFNLYHDSNDNTIKIQNNTADNANFEYWILSGGI